MFGNGKGLFGGSPMAAQPAQPLAKPREGPTRTQGILGTLGDMLATAGGGQAMFLPNLMQQRQLTQMQGYRAQQAKDQREADMQDWMARQAWERANPAPQQPTEMQRNYGWLEQNHPNQARDYLERMTNNYQYRQGPDGQFYRIDIAPQPSPDGYDSLPEGYTVRGGGGGQQMSAPTGTPPVSTTTPEGLGAMISVHGVDQVQRWMQNGQLTVRGN